MEIILGIIIGLVILIFLVAVHEFGHAFAALRNGVVVEEFGIGFPPRAWTKKLKSGILFSLNWLPLGGFVKLQGEHDSASKKGDYGAASYWQKTQILLAGVAINWIVAALLLTVLAWTGLPKLPEELLPNQFYVASDTTIVKQPVEVAYVNEGSPAEGAMLQVGDRLLSIDGEEIVSPESLVEQTERHAGEEVNISYERDGSEMMVRLQLNEGEAAEETGRLGVIPGQREFLKAGWSAPVTGIVTTAQFSWLTLVEVKNLAVNVAVGLADKAVNVFNEVILKKSPDEGKQEQADEKLSKASGSVAGPIGILGVIFPAAAKTGLTQLTFLTAIISLTLAVMNILPIPALDGGRWATMTVFRLLRRPLTKEREEAIQGAGFMVLITLIVVVTFIDIGKLF